MKKLILLVSALLIANHYTFAQTDFDGARLLNNDISGTARYTAMAGAFSALGGDVSAIKDNPAALGVFRKSEFTTTINPGITSTTSSWDGIYDYDDKYKMNFNQLGIVLTHTTRNAKKGSSEGLLMSNWAFNYNRVKNFSRSTRITSNYTNSSFTDFASAFSGNLNQNDVYDYPGYEPFDNYNVPWISVMAAYGELIFPDTVNSSWFSVLGDGERVKPTYNLNESGYLDEYSFSWAGNYNNRFFFGASINIMKYLYQADMYYSESFEQIGSYTWSNSLTTTGSGVGFKLGAIYAPLDFIRLGASLQIPTFLTMEDTNQSTLDFNIYSDGSISSPYGYSDYKFQSPVKTNLSAAFIIGQVALLDIEYDYTMATSTRILNLDNSTLFLDEVNDGFRNNLNEIGTFKAGVEFKANDKVALRAGYAKTNAMNTSNASKTLMDNTVRTDADYYLHNGTRYLTGGIGYRESKWFLDFAVTNKEINEYFYPYDSSMLQDAYKAKKANVITNQYNLLITLGFKL